VENEDRPKKGIELCLVDILRTNVEKQ